MSEELDIWICLKCGRSVTAPKEAYDIAMSEMEKEIEGK